MVALKNPFQFKRKTGIPNKKSHRKNFSFGKRQRFILSVVILSVGLFISEYFFSNYGFYIAFLLGFLTDFLLFFSIFADIKEHFFFQVFVLPFLYSLSFGLFYFLAPSRLITRIILTTLYALGLYSLFLSENIFTVASIRTIALLNGARIVAFVLTLVCFFFLSNIIFSLHTSIFITLLLLFLFSALFIFHAIWTYRLEKAVTQDIVWILTLSLCLVEIGALLWFWPSSPTIIALFLTAIFYILVGLAHIWLDKRLFHGVLWEYIWVIAVAFFILISFTHWQ